MTNKFEKQVGTCPKRGDSVNFQTKLVHAAATESDEEDAASSSAVDPFQFPDIFESTDDEETQGVPKSPSVFRAHEPPLSTIVPDGNEEWEVGNQCDDSEARELQTLAASILMKILPKKKLIPMKLL